MARKPPQSSTIDLGAEGMSASATPVPPGGVERSLGWKKNPRDERDVSARPMLGAPATLPGEWYGLLNYVIAAMDQSISSACVGFAIAAAIMIRLRMMNAYVTQVSAFAIYAWARMVSKADKDDPILDSGCYPRLAMQAVREHGVPSEEAWPFDVSMVNEELPWDVQKKASAGRITRWFRLDSDGVGLLHDVMHALVQGYPVVFGTFVDTAFMSHGIAESLDKAPIIKSINLGDARGGGHMMCIVAYRTDKDGQIEFLVLNSWGLTWGYRGMAWVHQDVMLNAESSDFHAMQVTNTGNPKPEKEAS
jgi:C1A family cysteine protease